MSEASSSQPTYNVNEKCLCYHGPLLYEAKIIRTHQFVESNTPSGTVGIHYFVHYKGWKATWDEFVPPSRLLKINPDTLDKQKSLAQNFTPQSSSSAMKSAKSKETGGTSTRAPARKDGTRGTKRARDEDDHSKRPELKLTVPETLKVQLVDDWENITRLNQLVTLPRNPTVLQILQEFEQHVKDNKDCVPDALLLVSPIVTGLQIYFDRSCGNLLLYRAERPQYSSIRKEYITGQHVKVEHPTEMSAIYGAEHLLRMLVNLPTMIANTQIDADTVNVMRNFVEELMRWMEKERGRLFQSQYETASLEYQNQLKS